ncbi:MAG: hypothetical protein KTR20_11440 [Cellvibrionaceae bacterium]|nr:hypothetical protein [Cellvibrionaceae bacterium]
MTENKKPDYGWWLNLLISFFTIGFCLLFFVDIYLPLLPKNIDRTALIVTLLLFQVSILGVYLLSVFPRFGQLIKHIKNSTDTNEAELKKTAQSLNTLSKYNNAKFLTGEALYREVFLFDGFDKGDYYAVNAPLQFEQHNELRRQVDIHSDRYQSPEFKQAHYSYPIFNSLNSEEKRKWITGILDFLETLSKSEAGLSKKDKNKITFYIPKEATQTFTNNKCSYFIGSKVGVSQCIAYLHIKPFIDFELRKPNSVLVIYNTTVINEIKDIVFAENRDMRKIQGIDEFIKFCKKQIE